MATRRLEEVAVTTDVRVFADLDALSGAAAC